MKYSRITAFIFSMFSLLTILNIWATASPLSIHIIGIHDPEKKNTSLLLEKAFKQTLGATDQQRIFTFYNASTKYVQEALKPYGYFKPSINKRIITQPEGRGWKIDFAINPGPAVTLSSVQVKVTGAGINDPAFQAFLQKLPIKPQDNLNIEDYQITKNGLYSLAAQRGYFNAKFIRSNIIIDLIHYQAQVIMIFDTGNRYRFGPTHFSHSGLRLSFLQRYLNYQEGDYYDNQLIQQTQQDLASSNYFKQVLVTPEPEHTTTDQVPVKIKLMPNNPRQYIFGLGYGTDTGARATLGLQLRQLNDRGHYFTALLRPSQQDNTLSANYNIPGRHPARDLYTLNTTLGTINQSSGNSRSFKVGPSYSTHWGQWNTSYGIYYLNENYNLQDLPKTQADLIVPNFHIAHAHRQALINPKKGYNLSFDVSGGPSLSSIANSSFTQEKIQGKALYTLPTHTRLITHAELGRTDIKNIDNLPLSLQLFAGGANSIRGYSYNSIGPGDNLLVASGEIQQRIYKQLYFALFYDVGNVGGSSYLSDLKQGAGPGVVFLSPIGSLELSIARRIEQDSDHSSWRFQFSMGPDL